MTKKDKIDPKIKPLVTALNKIQGIRTTFSCQGHPDKVAQREKEGPLTECAFILYHVAESQEQAHEKWMLKVLGNPRLGKDYIINFSKSFLPAWKWINRVDIVGWGETVEKVCEKLDEGIGNLVEKCGEGF